MADIPPVVFADAKPTTFDEPFMAVDAAEQIDNVPENASGLFCETPGCNNELIYAGRGRRPKFCDEHKKGRSKTATDKVPTSQVPKGLAKIRQDITEAMYVLGIAATQYDQYDGAVLIAAGPKFADSIVMIAARYPEFRKYLEKGGDGMMWVKVFMGIGAVVIPIGAHHGIIPMDEKEAYKRFVDPNVSFA